MRQVTEYYSRRVTDGASKAAEDVPSNSWRCVFLSDGLSNVAGRIAHVFDKLQQLDQVVILLDDDEELAAPKKVSKKKPSKKEVVDELIKVVDGAKKDFEAEKAKKAKKVVLKVAEPEPESESESEDESDDEEMEVEQITIDGDDYFLNEKTGDIYDPETQEIVGKSENGEHTLF